MKRIYYPFYRVVNLCRIPTEVRRCGCRRWPLGATHREMGEHMPFDHVLWHVRIGVWFSNGCVIDIGTGYEQ